MTEMERKPVKAILLAGSAACGKLRPPVSDLDVLIIDDSPWTIHRETRHGIELHSSIASEAAWRAVWQREVASDQGANIFLMAGSIPLYDPTGIGASLRSEAEALYAQGPKVSPQWIETRRRWLTDLVRDLLEASPESQPYICALLVFMAVPCAFAFRGEWQPRHKDAMSMLAEANPALFKAINNALRSQNAPAYNELRQTVEHLFEP
jgi:hypothetical protein